MFCWGCDEKPKENTNLKIKKIQNFLFKKNDKIGEGQFSQIYEGLDQETGNAVAVKVVEINSVKSKAALEMMQSQITILKQLSHPNILQCLGSLNSSNNFYIITQYCQSGDLSRKLKLQGTFDEQQVENVILNLVDGLQYLAQNAIVHRDIKTSNILIKGGTYKIGDFQFAVKSATNFRDISIGTPAYMSPQGLLRCQYGPKTDIWSLGIVLYELLHGQTPLSNCENERELRNQILKSPKFKNTISKQMKNFITLCLDPNQKTRVSITQIKQTQFIKKMISNLQGGKIRTAGINEALGKERRSVFFHTSLKKIKPQQAVSLLHYCRLIHKTTKVIPSMILQQWLMTLSNELIKATYDCTRQAAQKIFEVLSGYHKKYLNEHKVDFVDRRVQQAIKQCQNLVRSPYDKDYINFLLKQSQILQQSFSYGNLQRFIKYSKCQEFLKKKDTERSSNTLKPKNRQHYIVK